MKDRGAEHTGTTVCTSVTARVSGPAVTIALEVSSILISSPFGGLPVKNNREREMNLGVMASMEKENMWLTVRAKLLANRCSPIFPLQPSGMVWGVIP